jgi:phosphoribosylamine--glycine ligase
VTRCVIVGSGGREHALAWALAKSVEVVVTPGNPGIAAHGITCVSTPAIDLEADLFVVGPEEPLVDGLADQLRVQGKSVVGPGAAGAMLEGSKAYMKEFLAAAGVPSAAYGTFRDEGEALAYLATMKPPFVIKTDGLAAGKGVLVTDDLDEARRDVVAKLRGETFAGAGRTVVIEEALRGIECSLHVLFDGTTVLPLAPAQDFKRIGEDDQGANTGGMGAYAPMASMTDANVQAVMERIIAPTLDELRRRSLEFRGVLYAGVMLTADGPKLLEYNVRFGDPETEVLVPLYGEQLFDALLRCAEGRLDGATIAPSGAAVTVVLAAEGYPLRPRKGDVITGLGDDGQLSEHDEHVVVFHAATLRNAAGDFLTRGGRVLAVTGLGDTLAEARQHAYAGARLINFRGCQRRSDIALVASQLAR